MSPSNGFLLNGVLRARLLNNPFASCSFINIDVSLPHTAHFDVNIGLAFSLSLSLSNQYFLYLRPYYVNFVLKKFIFYGYS